MTQDTNPLSQGTKDGERAVKTIIKKLPGRSPQELHKQMRVAIDYDDNVQKRHE